MLDKHSSRLKVLEKIRRALKKNLRLSSGPFEPGDTIRYYKRPDGEAWKGPGTVIGSDRVLVFVRHGCIVVRVHKCRLQKVSDNIVRSHHENIQSDCSTTKRVDHSIHNPNRIWGNCATKENVQCEDVNTPNDNSDSLLSCKEHVNTPNDSGDSLLSCKDEDGENNNNRRSARKCNRPRWTKNYIHIDDVDETVFKVDNLSVKDAKLCELDIVGKNMMCLKKFHLKDRSWFQPAWYVH